MADKEVPMFTLPAHPPPNPTKTVSKQLRSERVPLGELPGTTQKLESQVSTDTEDGA